MGFATKLHRTCYESAIGQSLPMQGDLEGLKIPHRQGIHEELMEVWG